MNRYWDQFADEGVTNGSFLQYLTGQTMRTLGNIGYSLKDMGVAVYNNPGDAFTGGLKSIANFGPEAFNMATNGVKTVLNGYSMIAEQLGAGEGTFAGFRDTGAYNIKTLFGYDNQAQAGGALLTQAALSVGLAKYGDYNLELNVGSPGTLYANPFPIRLTAPQPAYSQYSVAFEMRLDTADVGRGDGIHFNRANAALDSALRSDPQFASMMDSLIPGVQDAVSSVGGRANPLNWTWEHASTSTAMDESGVMRLVPTYQHTPGSAWWRALHPDLGAAGGYAEWARPAGAPKR